MYPDVHSRSASLYARALKSLPGGNSRSTVYRDPYPLYAARGAGSRIWDVDGIERLDMVNNQSCLVHGHCHPDIVSAIQKQAGQLACASMATELEIELAEILRQRVESVERVCFSNSGSEAVLWGVRAARAHTGRDLVAKAEGAYHGNIAEMEISVFPSPKVWGPEDAPTSLPEGDGITRKTLEDTLILPFNNVEASRRLIELHAKNLACVIIDPAPPRLGFLEASPEYLRMLRDITEQHGIVLMFDEVYSFRQSYHGAQGRYGIRADLTSFGKLIGGGLPIGATGGREDIMAVFDPRGRARVDRGGTFNANPLTMAAGIAAMNLLTPDAFAHMNSLGAKARNGLKRLFNSRGIATTLNGSGSLFSLLIGVEQDIQDVRASTRAMMEKTVNAKTPLELGRAFNTALLNRGVLYASPCNFILSTVMTDEDIELFLQKSDEAADEILQQD